jgi:hypothetical protein
MPTDLITSDFSNTIDRPRGGNLQILGQAGPGRSQ